MCAPVSQLAGGAIGGAVKRFDEAMRPISVPLPQDVRDELEREAGRRGISRTSLARMILTAVARGRSFEDVIGGRGA